jgi:multisubunit Na+/H+ antiporter MnhF subunit
VLLVLSLVGFVGSVSMARLNPGKDDVGAERT